MTNKLSTFSAPKDLLERALMSKNGIRIWFATKPDAIAMRNRINTVKSLERKLNCKLYDIESPLFNTSTYDGVACHIQPVEVYTPDFAPKPGQPTTGFWLYLNPETCASAGFYIEELE